MTNNLEDEVQRIVAKMDNEGQNDQEQKPEQIDTIHIHYFPDAIVILKEEEKAAQVIDSTPVTPQKISFIPAYAICSFYLFLILSCIAFQVFEILNPPIATVTIIPKSQAVTLTGTLQLGRVLQPLTISQSQTVPATGRGHQPAEQARGYITFYNGQLTSVTVPAGTVLTAANGVQVITDENASIPRELQTIPPTLGHVTVSAHALLAGSRGNIPTGDINQACCAPSILAQNTTAFHSGLDERDFQTVVKRDIENTAVLLKTMLAQSVRGALEGQLKSNEQLFILPCTPTQTSDHQPGQEASTVKVSVSETCSAVAYNDNELSIKAIDLLSRKALQKLGTGFSLFGQAHVSILQAIVTPTTPTLTFFCQGTWVYAISQQAQQSIKLLIAGKPRDEAVKILVSLPGIDRASIEEEDNTKLPKNITSIHFQIIVQSS